MAGGAAVVCAMRAIALLERADPRRRRRADDREHAGRPRDQAGRRPDGRERQDRRGDQHRCRRAADSRRRAVVRAAAWRDASRRRRDADRRVRGRARQGRVGPVRPARRRGSTPCSGDAPARRRSLLADAALRRVRRADPQRDRRHGELRRTRRPARARRRCSCKEFAGGLPWAHLDIAGTAWADEAKPYQPKGPTGVAVRTLAELRVRRGELAEDGRERGQRGSDDVRSIVQRVESDTTEVVATAAQTFTPIRIRPAGSPACCW